MSLHGLGTIPVFFYLQEAAFKIHYSNLHLHFLLPRLFFLLTLPLSLPSFVFSVRKQALIVSGPQLWPGNASQSPLLV
jgi:hypothetical protein